MENVPAGNWTQSPLLAPAMVTVYRPDPFISDFAGFSAYRGADAMRRGGFFGCISR